MTNIIDIINKYKVHILIIIVAILAVSVVALSTQSQQSIPVSSNTKTATSTGTSNTTIPAKLTDIDVYTQYGTIKMSGKIVFTKDSSYQQIDAKIHLNDGTTVSSSTVHNWADVTGGETYSFDGYLNGLGTGTDKSLTDVKDIDFTVNGKTVGTWKNN
ncbi:MAG: hypothetical protein LBT10_01105 [Methanobrevibacter sp.]|jgi:hypothetical protein|nr:hypothetical protein [Methanobrevibacter sp.]